jgi:peptidoglycan/LPS O-acetylase OafA/YrhL
MNQADIAAVAEREQRNRSLSSVSVRQTAPDEFTNLDILRATAVLCVFYSHLAAFIGLYTPKNLGFFGVVLFFVHTSYVLMGSLERLETSGFARPRRLAMAFAIRRLFRIYPLSIVCVLMVPVFGIPRVPGEAYNWVGWPAYLSNLAITQNITHSRVVLGPLWTLPVEVQMYGFLPFLYMALRKGRYRSLSHWLFSVVASLAVQLIFPGRLNVIAYAPCFVAGIVAYDLSQVLRKWLPAWLWPVTLALAIAIWKLFDSDPNLMAQVHRAWLFALVLGVLVVQFREGTMPAVAQTAHLVAKYSYGIYVSHVAVFWLAVYRMSSFPLALRILVGASASVLVPVALYHLVEHPCIRLGSRYADRLKPVQASE